MHELKFEIHGELVKRENIAGFEEGFGVGIIFGLADNSYSLLLFLCDFAEEAGAGAAPYLNSVDKVAVENCKVNRPESLLGK